MSPAEDYKMRSEREVGTEGNGPVLLYSLLPIMISVVLLPISSIESFGIRSVPLVELSLFGIFFWLVISFAIALSTQIIFQLVLRYRFRKPYAHAELEQIISKVRSRMGFTKRIELWSYSSDKQVLLPLNGLISRAILISKRAEEDLLACPEYAEIILTENLRDVEGKPILSTWLPVFSYVLVSSILVHLSGMLLIFNLGLIYLSYIFFGSSIGIWSLICGRKITKDKILAEYNIHPDVARYFVFRNSSPTNQEIEIAFEKYRTPNPRSNDDIRGLVSYFAAIIITLVSELIITLLIPIIPNLTALFGSPDFFTTLFTTIFVNIGQFVSFIILFFLIMKIVYRNDESILN